MPDDIQAEVKPISAQEALQIMKRCMEEIQILRSQRDVLQPKAEAYNLINKIISLLPTQSHGYGEDIIWQLRKRIAELQSTLVKKDA